MATKKKSSHRLTAVQPVDLLDKPIKADLKGLFKGLAKGIGHASVGKWEELGNDAVEALGALGLVTEPGELISLLLQRSLVRALYDLVGEAAPQHLQEVTAEGKKFTDGLTSLIVQNAVGVDDKFFDQPGSMPLVTEVLPHLILWLESNGMSRPAAKSLAERLPTYFVFALNQEWRKNSKSYDPIIAKYKTPFSKAGDREWAWLEYTALLNKRIDESVFDEPFSLRQLYVPLNAYYVAETARHQPDDSSGRHRKIEQRIVVSLEKELQKWLSRRNASDAIRVISGGPGSGKSSFARVFAARISSVGAVRVVFVPLHLIDATKDLVDEVGRYLSDEGVLTFNPLAPDSSEADLLIIFDGLDELASQGKAAAETARAFIREVDRTVEKKNLNGVKLRSLISGRELVVQENESEFRGSRKILNLLPYYVSDLERKSRRFEAEEEVNYEGEKQLLQIDSRNEWWMNYGNLTGRKFPSLPAELKRSELDEITAQPLLNYLVALSYTRGRIDFKKVINLNLVYEDLVSAVYQRGYERERTYAPIRHLSLDQFNRVLEEIGLAAWHGDGRTTTVREIEEHCKQSGVGALLDDFQEGAKAGVTRLLAAFFFRQHGHRVGGDPTFVFTHKSFGEYLTACRIIRATERVVRERLRRSASPDEGWDERDALRHWLLIFGASELTPYLRTLVYNALLLKEDDGVIEWQDCLVALFSHVLRYGLPLDQIGQSHSNELFFRVRNAEEALLVILNCCAERVARISEIVHPDTTSFGSWLKRIQGQRTGPESRIALQSLSYLNLENVHLDIADLYRANLSFARMRGVKANFTCFETANLTSVDFSSAELNRANMTRSILDGATFDGARLNETDFSEVEIDPRSLKGARSGDRVIMRRQLVRDIPSARAASRKKS